MVGDYVFRITADDAALTAADDVVVHVVAPTGVESLLVEEGLRRISPNPVRAQAFVSFGLVRDSRARLTVHDVTGRLVAEIQDGPLPAGEHRVLWSGADDGGRPVAAGIYFVVLEIDGRRSFDKVTLLR